MGSGAHSTEDLDVHSVGNSQTLKETAIIEAENLKAAIEFEMKNSMIVQGKEKMITYTLCS